jgi:cell division ATPase FtsA
MQVLDIAVTKVDQLGMLMAQIADLEAQAEVIKNELKQQEGHIEGNFYKACVTLSQRKTVDNKAVFAEANVPADLIEKHTKTSAVITLKVTSR